jgi:hypothetical protein
MMMIEDNPGPSGRATNLEVMDVMLAWADEHISKPKVQACGNEGGPPNGTPPGLSKKPGGLPPGQAKKL